MDTEMFPIVPSQGKYVYVGGVWSHLGTPIAWMCSLYCPRASPARVELFHYEVTLRVLTKPVHKGRGTPQMSLEPPNNVPGSLAIS